MPKKIAGNPATDPTMPKVTVTLDGATYNLAFTFASLATAETEMKKLGKPINIFHAMDFDALDATSMIALLYAALLPGHPEISIDHLPSMLTVKAIPAIRQALFDAFVLSMVEPGDIKPVPLEQA